MQGPVINYDSFTLKTLSLYRKNFPNAIIILSTWALGDELVRSLRSINVHVIQNQPPIYKGINNINLQLVTSSAGMLLAKDLGVKYVLKTRTDQCIYHPGLDIYLNNILQAFPLPVGCPIQENRLVALSLNTFKFRMYGISDMFLYGHINDMIKYWCVPLDVREFSLMDRKNAWISWRSHALWNVCEVYLCTEFFKKIGRNLAYTLSDSYQAIRDHFIVIDQSAIDLYWHKYTLCTDKYQRMNLFDPQISFNDWLLLYSSFEDLIIDESVLDKRIT